MPPGGKRRPRLAASRNLSACATGNGGAGLPRKGEELLSDARARGQSFGRFKCPRDADEILEGRGKERMWDCGRRGGYQGGGSA